MTPPCASEASELWLAFRKGDREAFARLAQGFYRTLYHYGTKLTRGHGLVDDCIQELFLELWKRREYLGETDQVRFYLLKALRRKIQHETRRESQYLSVDEDLDFVGEFSIESRLIEMETSEWQLKKLRHMVSQLSKRQREVIYLKFYQELDYDQIAALMSITNQSARNLLHTALKDLKTAWFRDE